MKGFYNKFFGKSSDNSTSVRIVTGHEVRSGDVLLIQDAPIRVTSKSVRGDGVYVVSNEQGLTHPVYPELNYYIEGAE